MYTQCIHCHNIGIRRKRMVETTKVYRLLFAKELSVSLGTDVFKTTLYLAVSVSSSHLTLACCLWSQVAIPDKPFIFSLSSVIVSNQYCTRQAWNKFCSCPGNQRGVFLDAYARVAEIELWFMFKQNIHIWPTYSWWQNIAGAKCYSCYW